MKREAEVIVVGSGASAVHAAYALVEAGRKVLMLDVGARDHRYKLLIPDEDFVSLRRNDANQHRYFLGDKGEGVPFGPVRVGAQLTPPRQHIPVSDPSLAPIVTHGFAAMQSMALGGLAAGWGASAMPYVDADLRGWPISRADLQPHYDEVAERVGICGDNNDDLARYVGRIDKLLPPAKLDSNAESILARYRSKRAELNRRGVFMGRARLAACTVEHRGRGPMRYNDMEFWADQDRAVWRPEWSLEELKSRPNFDYADGFVVEAFEENREDGRVTVRARTVAERSSVEFLARRVVIGAGAINTARIVLRSLGKYHVPVSLLSNPYTYFPSLNIARLGRSTRDRRHSLTQLTMVYDPDGSGENVLQPQLYSYRSLLLFKLLKESPLGIRESLPIMRALVEYFVIVGIFHEDRARCGNRLLLRKGDDPMHDWLEVHHRRDASLEDLHRKGEAAVCAALRGLGCWPLRPIQPGAGSSIHYAGTFPMTESDVDELTTTPNGALRAAPMVSLADGSVFPHLPAKGLTYTLMANGNRVGKCVAREIGGTP